MTSQAEPCFAVPPLVMVTRWKYHAPVDGHAACDPGIGLNMAHAQPVESVPAGLRCREQACSRLFRGDES